MSIKRLFEMQKELDERIVKEKKLETRDLIEEKVLAMQVELAECANEWRGFKYWSENQEPTTEVYYGPPELPWVGTYENPLLEEYVDVLHFILSLGNLLDLSEMVVNEFEYHEQEIEGKIQTTMKFNDVFYHASKTLLENDNYDILAYEFLQLGEMLGFTWSEIEQAYYEKNKVNHERQNNGY